MPIVKMPESLEHAAFKNLNATMDQKNFKKKTIKKWQK